jgi:hypothetical protein
LPDGYRHERDPDVFVLLEGGVGRAREEISRLHY